MQIICKFLTSQKEANDALGPKGSLGLGSSKAGRGRSGWEGTRKAQEGPEALATSENVLPGPVSDLGTWGEGQDELRYLEGGKWRKRRRKERREGRTEDLSQSSRGNQAGSGSQVASVS